jgi:hypothetical protein
VANYLDILNSLKQDAGVASAASVSLPGISGNSEVERFRSIQNKMQTVANASIKQEIERIVALPVIGNPTEEEIDLVSRWYITNPSPAFNKLFPEQVKAMMQYHDYGGIVGPVKVGGGKTAISILIANDAYCFFGKRKILLIDPPDLIKRIRTTELPFYRKHISINIPFYWLAGESAAKRMMMAKSKRNGCYVVSYSLLSMQDGAELMEAIEPDLIIGDEIHEIASANPSARGRRFREIVKKYNPQIVGLSGTITKKSPRDYHFLAVSALQENCFMPRPAMIADEWSKIIDTNASAIDQFQPNMAPQPGPIKPLITWAKQHFPEEHIVNNLIGFRKAYNKRLETCPGVVASGGDTLGVSLQIISNDLKITKAEKESSEGWDKLQELVKTLVNEWVAPNGDELEHAMHIWRWRYELEGFGFYNDLFWPEPDIIAKKRNIPLSQAQEFLDRSKEHHELRQDYAKVLRDWIKRRAKKGLDTPFLIGQDMFRNGSDNVGKELYDSWLSVKESLFPEIVEREKSFVRVCDFRLKKVIEWAIKYHKEKSAEGALIWYFNRGVGQWLKDAFIEQDLPFVFCPAGTTDALYEHPDKFCIASLKAHHKGHNLQHYGTAVAAQWPRDASVAEQFMGRIHRNGQMRDAVDIHVSICSEFDKVLFASCLNDSAYIHQTTPTTQKLMYADYDERPALIPYSVLCEWGTSPVELNVEGRKLLEEKFDGKEE